MGLKVILVATLTAVAIGKPIPDPLHVIRQSGPAAGQVITKCNAPGQLALAYDDGPYQFTQKLSDTLTAGGAKGTLFVTGTLYGCVYSQKAALQSAYKAGHQIASHTWSHPQNFGSLSAADLTSQMTRLEQALVNIIGVKPTYMRPPYLATGGNVLSTMKSLGYRVITDDIDTGDWDKKTPQQSQQKFTQAGAGGNGHIPLMHETYASTVDTLTPWLINWAKNNNLKLVTVAECLGDTTSAYKNGTANGESSC
ncbi:carbohydrate esterase family 4 protein [Cucurbitaria berberidis CBS 394.84]|uniref:Carbohydrate esterase family 4 protein n=1 Tax=Cucurbitaria berberidis CBS 394.84 TaxID=1168544 RepID=A0A9P4GC82_9PLEO|nr:carbohydrate esterase family 4 protein [Cucurbitaria berberidis CBS 394.84]KAF1843208.1 carbohydrate esterase family 4 protein [Cucurbitaria berberidis CBS 394.84]